MNKILIHTCCGPCAIYPVETLRDEGNMVIGYFYPHNIHPYSECLRREETLRSYADSIDLKVIYPDHYDLEGFFQMVAFRESSRCIACYHERLRTTALTARSGKFDGFTSTLLYSKFQNHDQIRSIGESLGKTHGVPFVYRDFREGWKDGIEKSRALGMYRQQYCGCVYSERERYYKPKNAKSRAESKSF